MSQRIALLGAESTGKTRLAAELAAHLNDLGHDALHVPEYLREWCEREGRTPRPDEQADIAQQQAQRILQANAAWVIADTTPLMTAIYSEMLFADTSLYPSALAHQRMYDLTLITGLDLPWVADGLQRDGPQVRAPVDAMVRSTLQKAAISYQVVYGQGLDRLDNAIDAINSIAADAIPTCRNSPKTSENRLRNWTCEKCSDPECEHKLFSALTARRAGNAA